MQIHTVTVSPYAMNCYILACEETKEAVIIDAGDEADKILAVIEKENYKLKYLINTHTHVDHTSAVSAIKTKTGVPFLVHKQEKMVLELLPISQQMSGFGDGKIPEVDDYLTPDKEVQFGNVSIKVIETPGHTPGGVCLLVDGKLFAGDTLFAGSIGRTDLPGGSTEALLSSIKSRLMALDDNTVVFCGHGPTTTIGFERKFNPFLV